MPTNDDIELIDTDADDNYARHLAKVNESNKVVATQDIVNDQNTVIVKAGRELDEKTTRNIVKFKLLRPLEESIAIEGDIDGFSLAEQIHQLIKPNPIALHIHEIYQLDGVIKWLSNFYNSLPVLRQKLTVMSLQMPAVYQQSLFSAWLAAAIAIQMHLTESEQEDLFVAALGHDMGMLHIDEKVVAKQGELTTDEWRQIYAHPVIGEKIFASIPNISSASIRAVREHHERCDGSGYPSGKKENKLARLGQIIAMADTVSAVLSRFEKEGRGFRDLIPILLINSHSHFKGVYDAFILVLKRVGVNNDNESTIAPGDIPAFIDDLIALDKKLSKQYQFTLKTLLELGYEHKDSKLEAIQRIILNVHLAVRGAGILDEGYLRFLEQVKEDALVHAYREVEDFSLMLNEINFQFKRLAQLIRDYMEINATIDNNTKEKLLDVLNVMA